MVLADPSVHTPSGAGSLTHRQKGQTRSRIYGEIGRRTLEVLRDGKKGQYFVCGGLEGIVDTGLGRQVKENGNFHLYRGSGWLF